VIDRLRCAVVPGAALLFFLKTVATVRNKARRIFRFLRRSFPQRSSGAFRVAIAVVVGLLKAGNGAPFRNSAARAGPAPLRSDTWRL